MNIVKLSAIGTLVILIAGCATEQNYQLAVNSWHGANSAELIRSWGPPHNTQRLPNGHNMYTYQHHIHSRTQIVETPGKHEVIKEHGRKVVRDTGPTISGGEPYDLRCKTWFEVNQHNHIVSANFKGNDCLATNAEKQRLSH